jgi:hypothetical protein
VAGGRRGDHRGTRRAIRGREAGRAAGLGQTTGLLPRDHLTLESAIQVDLTPR